MSGRQGSHLLAKHAGDLQETQPKQTTSTRQQAMRRADQDSRRGSLLPLLDQEAAADRVPQCASGGSLLMHRLLPRQKHRKQLPDSQILTLLVQALMMTSATERGAGHGHRLP